MYDQRFAEQPFHDGSFVPQAKEFSADTPFDYRDGVSITVTAEDYTPDDDFLGQSVPPTSDDPDQAG